MHFKSKSLKLEDILSIILLIVLFISCIGYYGIFVADKGFTYEPIYGYINPVNIHDNFIYINYIAKIDEDINALIGINNNIGISMLYYTIALILKFIGISVKYEILALMINCITICVIFLSYRKIMLLLKLPKVYILTFFLCASLIYFSQLINKDLFTILFFLKCIEYSILQKNYKILLIAIMAFFIRFQLLPLFILYLFLIKYTKNPVTKLFLTYVILSIMNGMLSRYQLNFFNEKTLGNGISYFIFYINTHYFVGSLFFNPLRVVQYIHDLLISFSFIIDNKIDIGRLKNIPQAITFIVLLPFIIKPFCNFKESLTNNNKYFISLTISFFMIWLFNPTINVRYFICLLPVLQILGFYQLHQYTLKKIK